MSTMSRRDFSKTLGKGLGAAALAGSGVLTRSDGVSAKSTSKPNIVYICSDQHSYRYTGFMGHQYVRSPNLDKIAEEGVIFTSNYSQNPVCVPGRSALMTGVYASDVGSYCNSTVYDGTYPTWGKRLRESGYFCWATGKMDMNPETDMGFEEVDTKHGHAKKPDITSLFRRPVGYRVNEREGVDGKFREQPNEDIKKTGKAIDFIKNKAPKLKQPWAAFIGFHEPHPKFIGLKEHFDYYYPDRIDMPDVSLKDLEALPLPYQVLRHFKRIATPITDERIKRARAAYYSMITELDSYIGQIWNVLEETGQLENTIFIYTSDHGESLGEHGLWYKNNLYDVAARVPLVVAGPGLPLGKRIDDPVGHVDIAATILEWGGAKPTPGLRGTSLLPLIMDQPGKHPEFAFSETHSEGNATGSFMIRKGNWKLIHFTWYGEMLFNLNKDPHEKNNLIDDPATATISNDLRKLLYQQVDTEKVTLNAFIAQEHMLGNFASTMNDEELFDLLKGRLGNGQARSMVKMIRALHQ